MDKKYVFLYNGQTWFLVIDSLDVLNEYMDMVWAIRKEDLLQSIKLIKENKHPIGDMMNMCHTLARMKGTDIWHEYQALREKQHMNMSHMILDDMTLYVNPAGGYTIHLDNVMNRYESEELRWPVFSEEDIRIKQWPGGTHYYAYIGPIQVKDFEITKWDSESDARMAAMRYVGRKRPVR